MNNQLADEDCGEALLLHTFIPHSTPCTWMESCSRLGSMPDVSMTLKFKSPSCPVRSCQSRVTCELGVLYTCGGGQAVGETGAALVIPPQSMACLANTHSRLRATSKLLIMFIWIIADKG